VIRRSDGQELTAAGRLRDGVSEASPGTRQPTRVSPLIVGVVGLAIAVGIVLRLLIPAGMDPTIFLALGEDSTAQTRYAERLLGHVETRDNLGHDGKYFFIQANDPWLLDPQENARYLDRPIYRAQRMLYPMIAGALGMFPPGAVVWSMLITNVFVLGIGAALAAWIASRSGASPWLGLAVPLNIGLLFELWIGGSGILAYVFCLAAICAFAAGKGWTAAALFAAAALSRETMILFALGVFALGWLETRTLAWRLMVVPSIAVAIWHGYLRLRLMGIGGSRDTWPFFGPPFVGLVEAFRSWTRDPSYLVLNVAILILVASFVVGALRSRAPIAWGALPFVAMSVFLSAFVWREPFDISRAISPVLTAAPFLLFVPRDGGRIPVPEKVRS
jgi:hypothetical protein